jgi:hypothetical protein
MTFTTLTYVLFLVAVFALYWALRDQFRHGWSRISNLPRQADADLPSTPDRSGA